MRLNIDKEHKELKAHGNYAFPVLVSDERLSWFDTGEFPWHWHPEIELTIVLDGNAVPVEVWPFQAHIERRH